MKKRKPLIIALIIVGVIIAIFGLSKYFNYKNEQKEIELAELREQKVQLQAQKNEIFAQEGLSEEYYRVSEELTEVTRKLQRNSVFGSSSMFTIFGLIFALTFGLAIFTIFKRSLAVHKKVDDILIDNNTEEIEKMANVLGKVAVNMAKEMNPEYKSLKCPNCGAPLKDDVEICEYCDTPLTKVVGK